MKTFFCILILAFSVFVALDSHAQIARKTWHNNPYNSNVDDIVVNSLKKLAPICSDYSFGKSQYWELDIYYWNVDKSFGLVEIKFRFSWQIDYMLMSSNHYSLEGVIKSNTNGCGTRIANMSYRGNPKCYSNSYDLGCVN